MVLITSCHPLARRLEWTSLPRDVRIVGGMPSLLCPDRQLIHSSPILIHQQKHTFILISIVSVRIVLIVPCTVYECLFPYRKVDVCQSDKRKIICIYFIESNFEQLLMVRGNMKSLDIFMGPVGYFLFCNSLNCVYITCTFFRWAVGVGLIDF